MLDSLDTLIAFVLIMLVVSLLITIAVQLVASLLNLRGLNLAYGLKRTFTVIVPNTDENAKKLVNFILKGQFFSDSFLPDWKFFKPWRHATAIRPEEVFDAIQRIAIGKESVETTLVESAKNLLIALGVDKQSLEDAASEITTGRAANTLVTAYAAARQKLSAAKASIDKACQKLQDWTCIAEERAQQWLTMHTRIITVIFAFFFAFWLQLDTVEIFKLVSSNKAVRDKLVAQATAVSSQAEKILGNSPTVLQSAYDTWLRDMKDSKIRSALTSPSPAPVKIAATDTRESVARQIETALGNTEAKDGALKSFNDTVDTTVTEDLKKKSQDYREVQADFKDTGFDLFPKNPKNSAFTRWGESWQNGSWAHFWGILFSVSLLSLGAPFWYNLLKNLVSLRSTVAQNISAEEKESKKQPDTGKP